MASLRVLLADDHALVRAGMRSLLREIEGIEVVGEAADGAEALALAARERPDAVLLDIAMKGMGGLEAAARLRELLPGVKVIILSMHATIEHYHQAIRAGAWGYLLKESASEEVAQALSRVHAGRRYISSSIIARFEYRPQVESPLDGLSRREREILQLVAESHCSQEIARLLSVSPKTVETYRSRLMQKLGLRGTPDLVKFAIRHGLTSTE